jgi:DNA polymerase III epsilon subunit family exonuclease
MSSSGDTLLSKAKEYAKRAGKTNGPKVWKFVYQTENLKMLKHGQMSLQAVIDTILSQGIGRTESALEKRHEELSDPMACPFTSRLAARLLEAESKSVTVHVTACGGLEFVVFRMLRRAMPTLNAVYHGSEVYEENGIDFDLAPSRPDKDSHSLGFAENNGPKAIQLFRALQCVDSMRSGRMFGEYVCFDTETTGKDTDHCEIIELAAVKVNNGQIVDSFHSLINVNHPISPGASQVHGYYDEDLVGKPKMREVWPQFRQFVGNTGVVVHNGIKFDIPLVERLTWGFGGIIGMYFFDTLPLARSLVKTGGIRLVDLASLYGVDTGRSHRALDDSRCLAEVFEKLLHEWGARSRKTSLSNLLDLVGLGVAIENIEPVTDEEKLLVDLGNWKAMGPRSTALKDYEQELENGEIAGPCSSTLFERMGGRELYDRARTEKSNADRYPESYSRLTSIVSSITKPDLESAIRELLDVLALSRSDGAGIAPDRVNLLTHHSTKGLEFSRVYIVGLEDDMRAMQSGDPGALAEARRLLYVAMTRAKDRLFLTYCKKRNNRDLQGTTFLEEMGLVAQERNLPSSENWQDW